MASLNREQYLDAGLKLLPAGLAWNRASDGQLAKLIDVRAEQLANINQLSHRLLDERILSNAYLLLDDWENLYGLPECSEILTIEARRQALVAKDNEVGSFNKHFLEEIARQNGFEIRVVTYYPHHCLRDCLYPLHPAENAWRVFIYSQSKSVRNATCLEDVNKELILFKRSKVECFLKRFCYSHLEMIFLYEEA